MNEALPKICSTSSDPIKGGCECTDCIYNINHYDYTLEDWVIVHKANVASKGQCQQEKGAE